MLAVDEQRIWLTHSSGVTQKILKRPFTGKLLLEETGTDRDDYLLWKQKHNILAAVNRFNVVSFWNTFTGELIYKRIIGEGKEKPIRDAHKYVSHKLQGRFEDPSNQFDSVYQAIVSYKKEPKDEHDDFDCLRVRLMNLRVFEEKQAAFGASCDHICTAKINIA